MLEGGNPFEHDCIIVLATRVLFSHIDVQNISRSHIGGIQIFHFHMCNSLALESEQQHPLLEKVHLAGSLKLDSN